MAGTPGVGGCPGACRNPGPFHSSVSPGPSPCGLTRLHLSGARGLPAPSLTRSPTAPWSCSLGRGSAGGGGLLHCDPIPCAARPQAHSSSTRARPRESFRRGVWGRADTGWRPAGPCRVTGARVRGHARRRGAASVTVFIPTARAAPCPAPHRPPAVAAGPRHRDAARPGLAHFAPVRGPRGALLLGWSVHRALRRGPSTHAGSRGSHTRGACHVNTTRPPT